MNYVYRFDRHLFKTRASAEAALGRVPKEWGRGVGYIRPKKSEIEQVPVFISSDEWSTYTGQGR